MPTVYLAGKMTGVTDWNYPLFNRVAKELRASGWQVENPAETDGGSVDKPRPFYLREAIRKLLACEAIAMLPGWESSAGARLEYSIAVELGMAAYVVCLPSVSLQLMQGETILQEAQRLVHGDRNAAYGPPSSDFLRTCRMWSALGWRVHEPRGEIREMEPGDVAMGMCCVKLSRLANAYKRDSCTDLAGYAETLAMCHGD